jgi:hypothetical protein
MTYTVQFTEKMIGAFSFGTQDYESGYRSGRGRGAEPGGGLMFRLTIRTDDIDAFVADPVHAAVAHGYVQSDALGGHLPVEEGLFNLFVAEGPATRHMLYRLYFSDGTGRPLTMAGFKDVGPGPLTKVWSETSTLYVRVLNGHVPVTDGGESAQEGIVGSGVLRIRPLDFAWQLSTFRSRGPSLTGELRALDSFGRLFLAELWQVFDPFRPGSRHPASANPLPESGSGSHTDAGWALHPDVVDPEILLSHLERVRQARPDVAGPDGAGPGVAGSAHLDEIQRVLESSLDQPRARYQGAHADRPPPVVALPGNPQASVFQGVIAHCVEPLCPADEHGQRHPLSHWLDEIKDLYRQFGPCDPRWIRVRLDELLSRQKHSYVEPPGSPAGIGERAEIVLVGDWATALPQAINVSKAIRAHLLTDPSLERHVIHLGDTYYCGLQEEYENRFLPHWPVDIGSPVLSWALNGNHDMYTGGHGYFDTLLADSRFRGQRGSSNFILRNDYWQLVGIDSAYQSPDDPNLSDEQKAWLHLAVDGQTGAGSRQTILLSHHQAFTAFGDSNVSGKLAADVSSALNGRRVAAWFWGHEHRGTVYASEITARNYDKLARYTATVGHGGVPQLVSSDGRPATTVDETLLATDRGGWEFDGLYTVDDDTWSLGGYAVLSLNRERAEVTFFDENGQLRHGPTAIEPV